MISEFRYPTQNCSFAKLFVSRLTWLTWLTWCWKGGLFYGVHGGYCVSCYHTFAKLLQSEMSFVKGGRHLVFVYGTLKRGEPNHHWLRWDDFDKILILVLRKKRLNKFYSQIARVKFQMYSTMHLTAKLHIPSPVMNDIEKHTQTLSTIFAVPLRMAGKSSSVKPSPNSASHLWSPQGKNKYRRLIFRKAY